jgi:hypothetical protein
MTEPLDLDALAQQHYKRPVGRYPTCAAYGEPWPCPTSVLIEVVRRQNEALGLIATDHAGLSLDYEYAMNRMKGRASRALVDIAALVALGGDDD